MKNRVIRFTFDKRGPILYRSKIELEPPDDSRSIGEMWIQENLEFVAVYLVVPYFPDEHNVEEVDRNELEWSDKVESFYRSQHSDRSFLFKYKS